MNEQKVIIGKSRCEIWKTTKNANTGAESRNMINRGVVTKFLNDKNGKIYMVSVFNEELKKGHGAYQSLNEFYCISSKYINVKFIEPLKFEIDVTKI